MVIEDYLFSHHQVAAIRIYPLPFIHVNEDRIRVQPLLHFYSILRGSHSVLPGLNFQPPFPASLLIDMEVCSNIWNYASTITVQVQHLAFTTLRKNCCATISTHNLSTLIDVWPQYSSTTWLSNHPAANATGDSEVL
jgi:hypothetical protein